MHLRYPHTSKFFTWEELSCLTSALGYPDGTLRKCIPEERMIRKDGVSYREMLKLIDLKFFNEALHLSVNMHTADYNINVLRKSMNLLNHKFLTFDEMSDVRVAFQVYEAGDMKGMVIDKHTLMRTLKLCGRTIAPLKLMHRVKHMEERLDEPGRIQFYEFLDLIVLCTLSKEIAVPDSKRGPMDKTWRKLFELDNFEEVFHTQDEKVEEQLNRQFIGTERNYGQEILGSKRIPRESSVDPSLRKKQVRYHSRRYRELKKSITKSTGSVQNTKAGHVRARPVSASGVEKFQEPSATPLYEDRPHTVADSDFESVRNVDPRLRLLQVIHDKKTIQAETKDAETKGVRFKTPPNIMASQGNRKLPSMHQGEGGDAMGAGRADKPKPKVLKRQKVREVVTPADVKERQHLLDSLQYEIESLEERTMQGLHAQLKHLLPHHKFRSAALKKMEADELERARLEKIETERMRRQKKQESKKAAVESIERLVHPNPRAFHVLHDANCNAPGQAFAGLRQHNGRDSRSQQMKMTPKPHLMLDGQKLASASDPSLRLDRVTLDNVSSTGSIDDGASSVAQTTDIVHHTGSLAGLRQSRTSSQTPYDPAKFRESRMGTAAVLHGYFHDSITGNESIDEGLGTMPPASELRSENLVYSAKRNHDKEPQKAGGGEKTESEADSSQRKSSLITEDRKSKKSHKPTRKSRSPIVQSLQFERTKLTRKVQIGEEDELWLHGFPLSEIDRLTFKTDDAGVGGSTILSTSMSDFNDKEF